LALAEKFNGDLWRRVLDSASNPFGSVGQFVRVDIYSNAATRTGHALLRFETSYRLFEVISAARALKLNLSRVNVEGRKLHEPVAALCLWAAENAVFLDRVQARKER
jgi:hypothetical protein